MKRVLTLVSAALVILSCGGGKQKGFTPAGFPYTKVPAIITDREEAVSYLAGHFWDGLTDTARIIACPSGYVNGVPEAEVEQQFADYASILGNIPLEEAMESVSRLFDRAAAMEAADTSSSVFETLTGFVSKYFYDPNSPLRNEDIYLPYARKLSEYGGISEAERDRYAREAMLCSLNMTGTKAADFVFSDRNGKSWSLYGIDAEYTLLFFSNPGCHACKDIIDVLDGDPGISALVSEGRLAVLNIYIDSDLKEWYEYMPVYPESWYNGYDPNLVIREDNLYNVRAIPSLYLLDSDKRVIMKDAPQENVFSFLDNIAI